MQGTISHQAKLSKLDQRRSLADSIATLLSCAWTRVLAPNQGAQVYITIASLFLITKHPTGTVGYMHCAGVIGYIVQSENYYCYNEQRTLQAQRAQLILLLFV